MIPVTLISFSWSETKLMVFHWLVSTKVWWGRNHCSLNIFLASRRLSSDFEEKSRQRCSRHQYDPRIETYDHHAKVMPKMRGLKKIHHNSRNHNGGITFFPQLFYRITKHAFVFIFESYYGTHRYMAPEATTLPITAWNFCKILYVAKHSLNGFKWLILSFPCLYFVCCVDILQVFLLMNHANFDEVW